MSKHEIRLRKQRMTATGADRFRNFDVVMKRHERDMRLKKIIRVITIFAVILTLLLIVMVFVVMRISKQHEASKTTTALIVESDPAILQQTTRN